MTAYVLLLAMGLAFLLLVGAVADLDERRQKRRRIERLRERRRFLNDREPARWTT